MNQSHIKDKYVKDAIKFPASIQLNHCSSYKRIYKKVITIMKQM